MQTRDTTPQESTAAPAATSMECFMGTFRLSFLAAILIAIALSSSITADEVLLERRPYTAFDAMAEGARQQRGPAAVARRLAARHRRSPEIADRARAVAPRGLRPRPERRGRVRLWASRSVGRRPAGYVVIRRAPVVVYQQREILPPAPYPLTDVYGYSARTAARQPIGHFSGQTAPNRWEYRPLYGDDIDARQRARRGRAR